MKHLVRLATAYQRCGCSNQCACVVDDGTGTTVTGSGSAGDPYRVHVDPADDEVCDCIEVRQRPGSAGSVQQSGGTGTPTDPEVWDICAPGVVSGSQPGDAVQITVTAPPDCPGDYEISAEFSGAGSDLDEGCGIDIVGNTISVERSADCGNAVECRADGLYVHRPHLFGTATGGINPLPLDRRMPSIDPTDSNVVAQDAFGIQSVIRFYGHNDGTNPNQIPVGEIINPDECCPMLLRVSEQGGLNNVRMDHNTDYNAVIAAYQAAGGVEDFEILFDLSLDTEIVGAALPRLPNSRIMRFTYNPSTIPGTGVRVGFGAAENPIQPVQVPAGFNGAVSMRIFARLAINAQTMRLDSPEIQAVLSALFAGVAPYAGTDGGQANLFSPGAGGMTITGISGCDMVVTGDAIIGV